MDKIDLLLNGLDSVTWYNGLAEVVYSWLSLEPSHGSIACPKHYGLEEKCDWAEQQLQVIWMIAVEAFGDCGTSPRYGWIEDVEGFHKFCLAITKTWKGAVDRGEEDYG